MRAVSTRLRKYGLRYDDLYDPYHHLDIKEALARRPREVCLVPSPRIASSRPMASSARSSRRRGARPEGTRGSTDPSCSSFKQVIALPLPHRPIFPGFYLPIYVKDQKLLQALVENGKRSVPYAGAFLVKDEEGTYPNIMTSSDSEKSIDDLKGKELLRRLHEVGTLAQITSVHGDQVVLLGHRRLRITEMVQEDPLTVKVDHPKEMPYNKDDDIIKATSFEVISTLREVLRTSSLWKDHVQTYTQHMGDFKYPRLADFGAAISGANKLLLPGSA